MIKWYWRDGMKIILRILALPFIVFSRIVHYTRIAFWWAFTALILFCVFVLIYSFVTGR